jgi:hypothetical protein
LRRLPALVALACALVASGCDAVQVLPIEPAGCPAALLEGTLVRDANEGLAVHVPDIDVAYPVVWPGGWSIQETDGLRQLVDATGRETGTEGDHFSAGGGFTPGPDEVFEPCGGIEITPVTE